MKQYKYGNKKWLFLTTVILAIQVIIMGIITYFLRYITDYAISQEIEKMLDYTKISFILLLVSFLFTSVLAFIKAKYLQESLVLLKSQYLSRLLKQDITQLQKEKSVTYRSNLTNDFDNYEKKFLSNLLFILELALQFLVSVTLVALINWRLVIVAAILLGLFLAVTSLINKPIQDSEKVKSKSLAHYTKFVEENLTGFEIIKYHQLEKEKIREFSKVAKQVQDDNYKLDIKTTQSNTITNLFQVTVIFTLLIGGILVAKANNISLGSIIVITASFGNIIWPLQEFSSIFAEMKGVMVLLDEFNANLKRPELKRDQKLTTFNNLDFDNCDLGYPEDEKAILEAVNLKINKNEKVLIFGKSGAGKSTILKTIRQTLIPKSGEVLCNEIDIYQIKPFDYYSLFSTIDQIGFIFNATIYENITLFKDINKATVKDTLKQVGLSELPLDRVLYNNGANLSGGQKARILLARALVLNTSIILCDEIFANLDRKTALDIEKNLLEFDKTIVNVSHVVFQETLSSYDKIYLVENNQVRLVASLDESLQEILTLAQ